MALNKQVRFVNDQTAVVDGQNIATVQAFDTDGNPIAVGGSGTTYVLPAATAEALGGVKMAVFGNPIGNLSNEVAKAAGETPTKAEFDALVDRCNAIVSQFNRLISGQANAGVIQLPASS